MEEGFIKLFRKFKDWGWYSNPNVKAVFIDLLLSANWHESYLENEKIPVGAAVFSLGNLARQNGLTVQQTRTCLKKLEKTNEITLKSTNHFSIANIVKFNDYQSFILRNQQTDNKQITNKQQTDNNIQEYIYKSSKDDLYTKSRFSKNGDFVKNEKKRKEEIDEDEAMLKEAYELYGKGNERQF